MIQAKTERWRAQDRVGTGSSYCVYQWTYAPWSFNSSAAAVDVVAPPAPHMCYNKFELVCLFRLNSRLINGVAP